MYINVYNIWHIYIYIYRLYNICWRSIWYGIYEWHIGILVKYLCTYLVCPVLFKLIAVQVSHFQIVSIKMLKQVMNRYYIFPISSNDGDSKLGALSTHLMTRQKKTDLNTWHQNQLLTLSPVPSKWISNYFSVNWILLYISSVACS